MKQTKGASFKLFLIMAAISLVVAACGSNEPDSSTTSSSSPTEITIMSTFFTPEPPDENDPIKKELEARTNTKLSITWVSPNNYTEKSNVTLASGDMPDLLLMLDPFDPQVKILSEQGALWDLTPFIAEYPNLSGSFPQESWDNLKFKGGIYGIPRVRPLEGGSLPLLRNDWLQNLNLSYPTTMDELFDVLKAFTENDPDGNQIKDTVGLAVNVNTDDMGNLGFVEYVFNRSFGSWKLLDNGNLTHIALQPETREALEWTVKAYQAGIISEDFATLKASQLRDLVKANKAGGWLDAVKPSWLLTGEMRKTNPKADLLAASYLEGPSGKYAPQGEGSYGMFVIPKSVKEDKLRKILDFMEYGASEDGWVLANFGLENEHFTLEEDLRKNTEVGATVLSRSGMPQIISNLDKYERGVQVGIPLDFYKRNKEVLDARSEVSVKNAAFGLSSETYDKFGKEYEKKMTDLKVKIIIGSESIDAWDQYVETLKADKQFIQMIDEMNEAYQVKNQ
jgi:putative aldouronate transport system substrate-binding protein